MTAPLNSCTCDTQSEAQSCLDTIRAAAQHYLRASAGSHGWEHTRRVHRLCIQIGTVENADMIALEAAAYLHDIGRPEQAASNGNICHAARGAQLAEDIIGSMPLDPERKANIIHCVRTHRFRDGVSPDTIEAKCLFDADKLDAIGAIGIARAYQFAGELGARLHNPDIPPEQCAAYSKDDTGYREYAVKLIHVKDRMLTAEGKRLALGRHATMVAFFKRFLEEYDGRC